jgi:hypothetical protein
MGLSCKFDLKVEIEENKDFAPLLLQSAALMDLNRISRQ